MEEIKFTTLVELSAQLGIDGELFGLRLKSILIGPGCKENSDRNLRNSVKFLCSDCKHTFVVNLELEREQKPSLDVLEVYPEASIQANFLNKDNFSEPPDWIESEPDPKEEIFTQSLVEIKEEKSKYKRTQKVSERSEPREESGRLYECETSGCRRSYDNWKSLYEHERRKHGAVVCHYCNESVKNKTVLMNHFNKVHKVGHKKCPHCGRNFFANRLQLHMNTMHLRPKNQECHLCPYKSSSANKVRHHLNTTHKQGPPRIINRKDGKGGTINSSQKPRKRKEGNVCQIKTSRKPRKRKEVERHDYICHYCGETLENAWRIDRHFALVHQIGITRCRQCHETLPSSYLARHMKLAHGPKKLSCHHCSYKSNFKQHVGFHMAKHALFSQEYLDAFKSVKHKKPRMELLCECHGQVFVSRGGLEKHLRKKAEEKVKKEPKVRQFKGRSERLPIEDRHFLCPQCPKRFASAKSLNNHSAYHRNRAKEKRFACKVCGEKFHHNSQLRNHIDVRHEEKPWTCETCGEVFARKREMYRHAQFKHFKTPLFPCQYCDKKFKYPYLVRYHQMIHTGEKIPCPYPKCTAAYADQGSMSRHKKQHRERGDQLE